MTGGAFLAAAAFGVILLLTGVRRRPTPWQWAAERELELVEVTPRPFVGGSWQMVYDVRWRDGSGREYEGRLIATGIIRPKIWLD